MSDDRESPLGGHLLGAFVFGAALSFWGAGSLLNWVWQSRAVEHGAAHWRTDKYGNATFTWNDKEHEP